MSMIIVFMKSFYIVLCVFNQVVVLLTGNKGCWSDFWPECAQSHQ